jgi:hypothetical protein
MLEKIENLYYESVQKLYSKFIFVTFQSPCLVNAMQKAAEYSIWWFISVVLV